MTDAQAWLRESVRQLGELLSDEGRTDEPLIQRWLEHHPAFVPGARGPGGMSGWHPWPCALITQPPLSGIVAKVPDFCWLAADSADLTAILIEIETPAKSWQQGRKAVQSAPLTQAREQIAAWRGWFSEASNQVRFLDDYLVPSDYRDLRFRQHYVLVHGSRSEFQHDRVRTRQRAAGMSAPDEALMSFDRLLEVPNLEAACYGCVKREGAGFTAVAVPRTWEPTQLRDDALQRTDGYEQAVHNSDMTDSEKEQCLNALRARADDEPAPYRFRPPSRTRRP